MWIAVDILLFAAGFNTCWFTKDWITRVVTGTDVFIKALESKAAALRAALQ